MNFIIHTIVSAAWSIALAFLVVARDPATFVFRVRVDIPPSVRINGSSTGYFAVSRSRDVILNGEETHWPTLPRQHLDVTEVDRDTMDFDRDGRLSCRAYWGWVQFGGVVIHSPSQSCDTDTRYLVRLRPDPWR